MNLEKLIETYYAPMKGNELLVKLIESKLNEDLSIPVPEITPAIAKGREEELRNVYRKILSTPLAKVVKTKNSIRERLLVMDKYMNPESFAEEDLNLEEFLATFTFLQEFEKIIREYDQDDPKMAGMRFEMLTTVLLDGTELFGEMITDAVVAGENFSIKFIAASSKGYNYPILDGSLYNLLEMFKNKEKVVYLLCLKKHPNYAFKAFYLTPDNFHLALNYNSKPFQDYFGAPLNLSESELQQLMADGIEINRQNFHIYDEDILKKFDGKGDILAKYMQKIMGNRLERIKLFSPDFSKFVAGTKLPRELYNGTIACSHQGNIIISDEKLQEYVKKYEKTMFKKVFDFFQNSQRLYSDTRDYFSSGGKSVSATSILKDIDLLKEDFKDVSLDLMSVGKVGQEEIREGKNE